MTASQHCTRPEWCGPAGQCHEWLSNLQGCASRGEKAMNDAAKHGYFEFKDDRPFLEQFGDMEATSSGQSVSIAVTDVHAVGSYNHEFTCTAVLPREAAIRFRDWLNGVLT